MRSWTGTEKVTYDESMVLARATSAACAGRPSANQPHEPQARARQRTSCTATSPRCSAQRMARAVSQPCSADAAETPVPFSQYTAANTTTAPAAKYCSTSAIQRAALARGGPDERQGRRSTPQTKGRCRRETTRRRAKRPPRTAVHAGKLRSASSPDMKLRSAAASE
jgi:hypothetical protein